MRNLERIKEKIKNLTKKINYHNDLYYNKDNPEISDFEYDSLLKELSNLEEQYPQFKFKNSPTLKIGGIASSSFEKVNHKIYMGSLKNAYSFDELLKFEERIKEKIENVSYVVEPKVDGLSVSLEYENGKFVRGSTRGDGFEGEDVTKNLETIKTIPKTLNEKISFLEVRAEIYMSPEKFNQLILEQKNSNKIPFKNPRNAAAGSLRQKNPLITASRELKAICFNIQQIENLKLITHIQSIELLKKLGFYTIPVSKTLKNMAECKEEIEKIKEKKQNYDFEIDGAVVKINSLDDRKILGSTTKNPRWAIAFKYAPEEEQTILKEIKIKVGRTGVLTPVAIFDPVNISQTTINKASLHNQDFIDKNDIRINDIIAIRKAGEIIPEVVRVIKHQKNSKPYKIPTNCPVCGSRVLKINAFIRCVNPSCPATNVQNIIHFVSKEAMNISGLGEQTIKSLVGSNLIEDVSDIYKLQEKDIEKLEGFKEKSTKNLLNAIEQSKKNPPWRLLFGLGIKEVGQKTAKLICENYENILDIFNAKFEDLLKIKDIGEVTAKNIIQYFSLKTTKDLILELKNLGVNLTSATQKKEKDLKLSGLKFVITGKLENMSRANFKNIVEENGGKISETVSFKTNYLVVGKNPGSKLEKAEKLNVKILDEENFLELIKNKK